MRSHYTPVRREDSEKLFKARWTGMDSSELPHTVGMYSGLWKTAWYFPVTSIYTR